MYSLTAKQPLFFLPCDHFLIFQPWKEDGRGSKLWLTILETSLCPIACVWQQKSPAQKMDCTSCTAGKGNLNSGLCCVANMEVELWGGEGFAEKSAAVGGKRGTGCQWPLALASLGSGSTMTVKASDVSHKEACPQLLSGLEGKGMTHGSGSWCIFHITNLCSQCMWQCLNF